MSPTTPNTYALTPLEIDGVQLLQHPAANDQGGISMEVYRSTWEGLPRGHAQRGFAWQRQWVCFRSAFRGLELRAAAATLVTCSYGTVTAVLVDLRAASPTFRKATAHELSVWDAVSLVVPPGVAVGFLVLSQHAVVNYNCDSLDECDETTGVTWRSPEIAALLPEGLDPIVAPSEARLPTVEDYLARRAE